MCGSVVEGVIHQMVQGIAPRCALPHIRAITPGRFLHVSAEVSRCGYTEGQNVPKGATHGFHCAYGLNKPKPMKKYIGGTSCGEIQGGRPAGAHIPPFSGGITTEASESHQSLFVDLYHMCGSVMKCVMVHYIARRCDLAHVRGITLITDSPKAVCSETLIFGRGRGLRKKYLSYCKSIGRHICKDVVHWSYLNNQYKKQKQKRKEKNARLHTAKANHTAKEASLPCKESFAVCT